MYKIVITLCLLIPAFAHHWELNLLECMQFSLNKTLADTMNQLKIQFDIAEEKVFLIASEVPSEDPLLLKSAIKSDDKLITIRLPADSGSNQNEVTKYSEPANECSDFVEKNFSTNKDKVRECSEFQLRLISSYKQTLITAFENTVATLNQHKAASIECDRNSTTVISNMIDALCVRNIEIDVSNVAGDAIRLFANMVRNVQKVQETWTLNVSECMTRGEEPAIALQYLKVAIKIIDTNRVREPYVIKNLTREAKLLAKLQHPSVVHLYETIRCNSSYYLVTELATGGDLYTHIRKQPNGHLDESTAKSYARQLVSALNHIHLKGIVHRDLKMENIMLRDARKKHIKIIDFGLSNWSTGANHLETHCGSPEYAAPELFLEGQKYGPEVDLWSLGVILYGMVTGELPFLSPRNDKTSVEEWRRKLMAQIFRGLTTLQEKKISIISRDYKNLVRRLLEPVAHRRIPMVEIFRHPWLYDRNKNVFDVTFQSKDNFKADVLRSIIQEINAVTRLNDLHIHEKIRHKPYGEIGGMFNIKAHKLLGTGSIDVFEASPSSIGQKIRTVGGLLSRESSSRISTTKATSIPNNSCVRSATVSNENRSQAPILKTAKREEKKSKRSFSNCNSVASSNSAMRTFSQRREFKSEKSSQDHNPNKTVVKSASNSASISTRPMTQPLILESPARQLSSSLTKPANYSRYRPSCPGPSILPRDEYYVRLQRSLENKDKIYQQRYSTPDVGACTKRTDKNHSATQVHKIGRIMMPLVSTNWPNSRLLSHPGKNGSRKTQNNEIFSKSTTEKYEKYHQNPWTNSHILAKGKTFLWSRNAKKNVDSTNNCVKN